MRDRIEESADAETMDAAPKQTALSRSGLVMSILGFVGVTGLVTDLFFNWIRIDRYVDPFKFFGASAALLVLGSIFSRLFGSQENQRNSRSLFQGALLILIPVVVVIVAIIGFVFWLIWQTMEKS